MRNVVFRNFDRTAIKHLLKEIGEHALRRECDNKHVSFPKRLALFYIESGEDCTMLKYKYPQIGIFGLMKLDRHELPKKGWERVEVE